jgi:N-acetylglucosamine kinase-like BadF-type ATPase
LILIADSGATKSDWVLVDQTHEKMSFQLVGMNPFYIGSDKISENLKRHIVPFVDFKKVTDVFFYGAGCSSQNKKIVIEEAIQKVFSRSRVTVESDLLGSARSLFRNDPGLTCILGTGSNSCFYDGHSIAKTLPSLGYFFADEGSGAHMGKIFIKDYLQGNLPPAIEESFIKEYNYTRDNILDAIYNLPFPNRFLASFCDFYADHLSDKYIFNLVTDSFREFFIHSIEKYRNCREIPISFSGSVAYFFESLLRQIGAEFEVKIERIIQSPIKGLADYHKHK